MLHLEFKLRFFLTVFFVLGLSLLIPSPFCAQSVERPIRVAARICPPFVMNDAGEFSGLSIFLWDNIALEIGHEYSIKEYGLDEMLESIFDEKPRRQTGGRLHYRTAVRHILAHPVLRISDVERTDAIGRSGGRVGSTLMIASVTALLASAFTLDQIRSEITGPQAMAKVKVGALEASTSLEYLQEQGINSRNFSDRQKLLAALDAGSLGAVVADGAVLKYIIKKAQAEGRYESFSVLPFEFEKQSYAFALPENSPYLEKFNQALLSVLEGPLWRKELVYYLGK